MAFIKDNREDEDKEVRKGPRTAKDLKRERGWDNRFYLGKIPTYNPRKQSMYKLFYYIRRFSVILFEVTILFKAKTKKIKFK